MLVLGDWGGRSRRSLVGVWAGFQVRVHGRGTKVLLVHPGMQYATSWRLLVGVADRFHALARGSGSRLLLLDVWLRSSLMLLLLLRVVQDRLVRRRRFSTSEEASVRVLAPRRESRPLLLHLWTEKRG